MIDMSRKSREGDPAGAREQPRDGWLRVWLWPTIDDRRSAEEAAKLAVISAAMTALSYLAILVMFVSTGEARAPEIHNDPVAFGIIVGAYGLLLAVAGGLAVLVYRGNWWAVPIAALWALLEVAGGFMATPGRAVVVRILVAFASINGLRGWLLMRRYPREPDAADVDRIVSTFR